jgi:hypothetical protein
MLVEGSQPYLPYGFQSKLMEFGRKLVRLSAERQKPDDQRLREYANANLPAIKQALFDDTPIHPEAEVETLTFSLGRIQEDLGVDNDFVKRLFQGRAPEELARMLV